MVVRDRHDLPHALQGVRDEGVLALEIPDRIGGDRADPRLVREPKELPDLRRRGSLQPVLHRHVQPLAERLPERLERIHRRVVPPRHGELTHGRRGPEQADQPLRVSQDLFRRQRGVAAFPRHVRIRDQPAQVGVSRPIPGQ